MNVGLYCFLTFLVVMIFVNNSEDKYETPKKNMVSKIKKPDFDKMQQVSSREIRDIFRESKQKLDEEYRRFQQENRDIQKDRY